MLFFVSKFSFFEVERVRWGLDRFGGHYRITCLAADVYIMGWGWAGLGSIFPTRTPKCLAQLAVYVTVEVRVYIRGKCTVAPLFQKKKKGFSSFCRPNNLFFFHFTIFGDVQQACGPPLPRQVRFVAEWMCWIDGEMESLDVKRWRSNLLRRSRLTNARSPRSQATRRHWSRFEQSKNVSSSASLTPLSSSLTSPPLTSAATFPVWMQSGRRVARFAPVDALARSLAHSLSFSAQFCQTTVQPLPSVYNQQLVTLDTLPSQECSSLTLMSLRGWFLVLICARFLVLICALFFFFFFQTISVNHIQFL